MSVHFILQAEKSLFFPYLLQILFVLNHKKKKVKVHFNALIPSQKQEIQKGLEWIQNLPLTIHFFDNKDFIYITTQNVKRSNRIYPKNTFEKDRMIKMIEMKTGRVIFVKSITDPNKYKQKLFDYNQIMKQMSLPYRFDVQVYSRKIFYDRYKDRVFVSNYIHEYSEILKDEYIEKTRFSNPSLVLEKWNAFQWIMEMIVNGDIQKVYQDVVPDSREYLEMQKLLLQLEEEMIKYN
jgi:hypothetical protein